MKPKDDPDCFEKASPRPWAYRSAPSRHGMGQRDWIEDANGGVVVEHVGHIDGLLIVAAVNRMHADQLANEP